MRKIVITLLSVAALAAMFGMSRAEARLTVDVCVGPTVVTRNGVPVLPCELPPPPPPLPHPECPPPPPRPHKHHAQPPKPHPEPRPCPQGDHPHPMR